MTTLMIVTALTILTAMLLVYAVAIYHVSVHMVFTFMPEDDARFAGAIVMILCVTAVLLSVSYLLDKRD